ncbi:glycosyltransferase [Formosa haliotis]|uniref:glycosyltransferase n=1 Tax=Formosa haliotis TaxID=1555194 RepID=UPI00082445A2|nr:glycosyltransferase [Formosa haliotis]
MKTAIVSPSGKFYGSEQTLFAFLCGTHKEYDVYIKKEYNGLLEELNNVNNLKHTLYQFDNLNWFYLTLAFKLFYRYNKVYVNEGGHSKYIIILARLFFWRNFIIHVRLTEDTEKSRLKQIPENVKLISTSEFIASLIYDNVRIESQVVSSPARAFKSDIEWNTSYDDLEKIKVGVIGRVSKSKGLKEMYEFIDFLEQKKNKDITFFFFGHVDSSDEIDKFVLWCGQLNFVTINFKGFIKDKIDIYQNIDVVIHFNKNEPLGVIFLESLNQGVPIVGFNSGGIGCIAKNLSLDTFMLDSVDWHDELLHKIKNINIEEYKTARLKMLEAYSPDVYINKIDSLIN